MDLSTAKQIAKHLRCFEPEIRILIILSLIEKPCTLAELETKIREFSGNSNGKIGRISGYLKSMCDNSGLITVTKDKRQNVYALNPKFWRITSARTCEAHFHGIVLKCKTHR